MVEGSKALFDRLFVFFVWFFVVLFCSRNFRGSIFFSEPRKMALERWRLCNPNKVLLFSMATNRSVYQTCFKRNSRTKVKIPNSAIDQSQ